jgi:hypothetical protein
MMPAIIQTMPMTKHMSRNGFMRPPVNDFGAEITRWVIIDAYYQTVKLNHRIKNLIEKYRGVN